jgi:uncharacterized protein (TIGR02145 family)
MKNKYLIINLLFIGFFCIYTTSCDKENDKIDKVTDIDGNVYHIITIGTQVWMVENLKTTKFNDGSSIPLIINNSSVTIPGYCWYNNDSIAYKDSYGALYNWFTINTGKLAPQGWHVPTDEEWTTLTTFLLGEIVAGGKLKETGTVHWQSPNSWATNESGFSALPGGSGIDGEFFGLGYNGYWWSFTEKSIYEAWYRYIGNNGSNVNKDFIDKNFCLSVRCIKD